LPEYKNPLTAGWAGHNSSSAASIAGPFVSQGRALGFVSLKGFSGGSPRCSTRAGGGSRPSHWEDTGQKKELRVPSRPMEDLPLRCLSTVKVLKAGKLASFVLSVPSGGCQQALPSAQLLCKAETMRPLLPGGSEHQEGEREEISRVWGGGQTGLPVLSLPVCWVAWSQQSQCLLAPFSQREVERDVWGGQDEPYIFS
jgi:hypothetical protein